MRKCLIVLAAWAASVITVDAQVLSGASNLQATPVPHTTVPFRIEDTGKKLPDITWGLDLAWIDEWNIARGMNYAGDIIDIIRLSFQTTHAVENGQLSQAQKAKLDERIGLTKKWAPKAVINLNSDQDAGVIDWYHVYGSQNQVNTYAPRWAALIAATKKYVESKGLSVVSVSPFNEPDHGEGQRWGWQQGSKAEMKEICRLFREDPAYAEDFKDVLLCGGNTLGCDPALPWYNYCKDYLDEGNTHQLSGTMQNFVDFYKQVAADGKTGVADELHNVMECMIASEYGLGKAIWWGTCEHTRSQFMKASRGTRMAYAENLGRYVGASVYRHKEGYAEGCPVQGFVGTSERQACATTFRFAALDHDVFYNGQGPAREFIIDTPGWGDEGGYNMDDNEQLSKSAETVFNIQDGEDIMPTFPTEGNNYRIVNRLSGKQLAPKDNVMEAGKILTQQSSKRTLVQQWTFKPLAADVGGDFSYFIISSAQEPSMKIDVKDWNLYDRGELILWNNDSPGTNEQWFLEYAAEGCFYIRNRFSGMYLQVDPMKDGNPATESQLKMTGQPVKQGVFTGGESQQWKIIPGDVTYNTAAPAVPTNLTATPQNGSVRLEWQAPKDRDLAAYIVLRSKDGVHWNTIHNSVTATAYVDNTVDAGVTYYYKVRAVDTSLNRSDATESVQAQTSEEPGCIMLLTCDSLQDASVNGNHAALYGTLIEQTGKSGKALQLNGTTAQFLQLPATIANSRQLTVTAWVNLRSANNWQRIFDFGNDTDHYVFLTNKNSYTNKPRLAIKNGGEEQSLDLPKALATSKWLHLAVVFGDEQVKVYLDGVEAASSTTMDIRPADFRPIFNYVGRSQFNDPLLRAFVDDFRVYNTALSDGEVAAIAQLADGVEALEDSLQSPATDTFYNLGGSQVPRNMMRKGVFIVNGRKVIVK